MINTVVRVLTGFVAACLIAGLVQVLFVMTPAQLLNTSAEVFPTRAGEAGVLTLLAATHASIFAAAFALIAAALAEWRSIRGPLFFLLSGAVIGLLGFAAQYSSEVPGQPTIFNNYAFIAYLASGFFAGLAYWLIAGRSAGGRLPTDADGLEVARLDHPPGHSPAKSWKMRPRIIVDDSPKPGAAGTDANARPTLSDRLAKSDSGVVDRDAAQKVASAEVEVKPHVRPKQTEPATTSRVSGPVSAAGQIAASEQQSKKT